MTLVQELKPCPFCGGTASAEGINRNNVGCDDSACPAYIVNCSTPEWNRRAFADKLRGKEMKNEMAIALANAGLEMAKTPNAFLTLSEKTNYLAKAALALVRGMIL